VTVTEADLQQHVRARLRSTCTPEQVHFQVELPYSETGKLLRRVLKAELSACTAYDPGP
jgi:acyl-coenzyme A synthetase/AMP-(fatty) acid ligase